MSIARYGSKTLTKKNQRTRQKNGQKMVKQCNGTGTKDRTVLKDGHE